MMHPRSELRRVLWDKMSFVPVQLRERRPARRIESLRHQFRGGAGEMLEGEGLRWTAHGPARAESNSCVLAPDEHFQRMTCLTRRWEGLWAGV